MMNGLVVKKTAGWKRPIRRFCCLKSQRRPLHSGGLDLAPTFFLCRRVGHRIIGEPRNIIETYPIKFCQPDKYIKWNVLFSGFVQ